MSKPDFTITQGDLLPSILATLRFDDETIANLTGATVTARFQKRANPLATPSATVGPVITGPCTILSAPDGTIQYDWLATQTDTPGDYDLVFEADFSGSRETFPNNSRLHLQIKARIT